MGLENAAGVPLLEHTTGMGALQRGRGTVGRDPEAYGIGGPEILSCVCLDPRWDGQAEGRSHYYAGLIVRLDLGLDPLRQHLFDPEDVRSADGTQPEDYWRTSLTIETLGDLAVRGRDDARALLRDYAVRGANWEAALDALADDPHPEALGGALQSTVLAQLDDDALADVVEPAYGPWQTWALTSPRVAQALHHAVARRAAASARPRFDPAGATLDELRSFVNRGQPHALAAAAELGRRRDSAWLLARLDAVMAEEFTVAPGGLVRAIRGLPAGDLLPWARARAHESSGWPLMLLAAQAEAEDIPLLVAALREAIDTDDWTGAVAPVQALGRLRSEAATPLLLEAWPRTAYAYLRPRLLRAQLAIEPAVAAEWLTEGLWDSDDDVRELAMTLLPRSPALEDRARQLADDPTEEPATRDAARNRLRPVRPA